MYPDYVERNWWRKEGHELCIDDIKSSIERESPEILIVGTGAYANVTILNSTKNYLEQKGTKLIAEETSKACTTYNQLMKSHQKVLGAFHLTC